MAQNFDPDAYRKIVSTVESLRGGAIARLPQAFEVVMEDAKASGSANLISTVENAINVGIPAFIKTFNELLDSCDTYTTKAKGVFNALGVEV
jgi:hypothetical protein